MHQHGPWPERAGHGVDARPEWRVRQVSVTLGGLHVRMTQQLADHFQRRTAADQQGREGMAQIVDPNIRRLGLLLDVDPEHADFLHGLPGRIAGEQPWAALRHRQLALAIDG